MPPPLPPVPLQDHCSVIHNDVLYVYSPDAFQSLPLRKDATWTQEPMGVSVTGAACALGGVDGNHSEAALYVVGGSVNSSVQYPGLQRYSLADKRWDTITPVTKVTQNRNHHGAVYLNASSSLLVYAGSQDGDSNPSTQTFLIETWPPYNVRSYSSRNPPAVDPIVLTWSDNRAATVGGSSTNDQLFTFGPEEGWVDSGVKLKQPLPDRSVAQNALLDLVDGSKVLLTFDTAQSPNTVTRNVVLNPGGHPAQDGETVGGESSPRMLSRADVLLSTFPAYNGTLAPDVVRSGASLAQDPEGLTVITGGNDQSPLSIFDALGNRWVNATELIGGQSQPQNPLSAPSASTVSTPTSATTSSTSTPTPPGSGSRITVILAAVLGSILGIAAILILALLLLRWKRQKASGRRRGQSDYLNESKRQGGSSAVLDQCAEPIKPAAQPMGVSKVPSSGDLTLVGGQGSHTRQSSSISSRLKSDSRGSNNHSFAPAMFSRNKNPPAISHPIPHHQNAATPDRPVASASRQQPNPAALRDPNRSHRKNDSSWSTYFSGNTAVAGEEPPPAVGSQARQLSSESRGGLGAESAAPVARSRSANPGLTDSHGNPLEKLSVPTGSPSLGHAGTDVEERGVSMTEGLQGRISNTESMASSVADESDHRRTIENDKSIGSAYPTSPPTGDYSWAFRDSSWSGPPHRLTRPPSSIYTNSIHQPNATSPWGEDGTKSTIRPVTRWPNDLAAFPATPSSRPGTSRGPNAPTSRTARLDDDSRGNQAVNPISTDMSWLNLGTGHSGTS